MESQAKQRGSEKSGNFKSTGVQKQKPDEKSAQSDEVST